MANTNKLPLLSKEALAIKLNVSADTIDGWILRGKITPTKVGRRSLFHPDTQRPERKPYTRTGKYSRTNSPKKSEKA